MLCTCLPWAKWISNPFINFYPSTFTRPRNQTLLFTFQTNPKAELSQLPGASHRSQSLMANESMDIDGGTSLPDNNTDPNCICNRAPTRICCTYCGYMTTEVRNQIMTANVSYVCFMNIIKEDNVYQTIWRKE